MSHLTQVQKLDLQAHDGIALLKGETVHGDAVYAYVKADKEGIEEMLRACEIGSTIDYSRYKEIIKQDWGEEPPENVKRFMESRYGFKHF